MTKRHKGFVVGVTIRERDKRVWTVKVKDPDSPYHDQKFVVASVAGNLELARGLNVDFAVGTVDDAEGRKIPRAVDVRLESHP